MISERVEPAPTTVVVIGASGFIGEHLVDALADRPDLDVRVMLHRSKAGGRAGVAYAEGDLLAVEKLDAALVEDCVVINLAYLVRDNLQAVANLAKACARKRVHRLIHCSTAVVAGRSAEAFVTEETPCRPMTEYEKTKLQIEQTLLEMSAGQFEITILRPTAVFGPGGRNLIKLAQGLTRKNLWVNYVKSSLFGHRSMNLVAVENVVAALKYLISARETDRQVFIISDDDSPLNNYRDIEDKLLAAFGKSYAIPRLPVPRLVLGSLLWLAGRSSSNPSIKYSDRKLAARGFCKPQDLGGAVDDFARWYQGQMSTGAQ
jgi:nucleoside-diphosphate-sugar epimerase